VLVLVVIVVATSSPRVRAILVNPTWASTSTYPGSSLKGGSCFTNDGFIHRLGGIETDNQAWFAPISSTGIGAWQQTTAYGEGGVTSEMSCAVDNGVV